MARTAHPKVVALAFQTMWALDSAGNVKDADFMPDSPDTLIVKMADGSRFTITVQPLNAGATLDPEVTPTTWMNPDGTWPEA